MSKKYPFLDLLDKKLDDAQNQALETTQNAVITAGAGSGKTQVLATRFSCLVLTKQAKADQILTLTFTNKAAAEMYQRIYQTLLFYANQTPGKKITAGEIQLAKEGLSDFANAHIQTLDSYCANILRQCSNRYGIKPDFSTGSSDGERQIKNAALKFTLKRAEEPGIKNFAKPGKLQEFAEKTLAYSIIKFTSLASPDGFFTAKIPAQVIELCNAVKFYTSSSPKNDASYKIGKNISQFFSDINDCFDTDFDPKKHTAYKIQIDELQNFFFEQISDFQLTKSDILEQTEACSELYRKINLFKEKVYAACDIKGKCMSVSKIITVIKNDMLSVLGSITSYINQFASLQNLFKLLDDFLSEINIEKRRSGNLTFVDVSQMALKILIENPDIREQEIAAYSKIMIDEFQDNNSQNRDMLYLISLKAGTQIDGEKPVYQQIIQKDENGNILKDLRQDDKLFFVGDEKQSIYKFRGAEVSVFNELTSHGENKSVIMNYNYRSAPETVMAFNTIFKNGSGIFNSYINEKSKLDYEAYYDNDAKKYDTKNLCELTLPELTAENIPLHIKLVNQKKIESNNDTIYIPENKLVPAEEQVGYFIASKIYEMGKAKKNWKDFAILDRSRSHRASITKYLTWFNIPYQVDRVTNLFTDGLISDFYNIFRICVYPSDINAYAAYLTSPFCGLSENSVELILSHLVDISNYDFIFDPFADFDQQIQKDLTPLEFQKYTEAKLFFKENRSNILRQKITDSLSFLWNEKGYKYETMITNQTDLCAEQFDLLFELARQCENEGKSLAWFIDQLDNLKSSWSSDNSDLDAGDVSYPLERKEAVQIMTIHKSKGLQFEHVFLCGCTNVKTKSDKSGIFFDEKTGLSIKAEDQADNYFSIRQKELEKQKELAEFRRLIYVGITRAIKDVFVVGIWGPNENLEDNNENHIFERYVINLYSDYVDGNNYKAGYPFDFEEIQGLSYKKIREDQDKIDFHKRKEETISVLKELSETAGTIEYQSKAIPKNSPSALEKNAYTQESEDKLKDQNQLDSKEAGRLQATDFSAADFGVLVHAFLEAFANGTKPENFVPPVTLLKGLEKESDKTKVLEDCIHFTNTFAQTDIGKEFLQAKEKNLFYRAEWGFKMYWQKTLWTGSIDLIYQKADGTYQIIDYKSDNKVDKEKYLGQQNCYKVAAAKMLDTTEEKVNCKLWFMKENTFVDL